MADKGSALKGTGRFDGSLDDLTDESILDFDMFVKKQNDASELLDSFKGEYIRVSLNEGKLRERKIQVGTENSKETVFHAVAYVEKEIQHAYLLYNQDTIRIGRYPSNEFCIFCPCTSRRHGIILLNDRKVHYRDIGTLKNGSKNGTWVNGAKKICNQAIQWNQSDFLIIPADQSNRSIYVLRYKVLEK